MDRPGSPRTGTPGTETAKARTATTTTQTTNESGRVTPEVLADLIRVVNSPDYAGFMAQLARVGGCANPRHLRGSTIRRDANGRVVEEFTSADRPDGVLLMACRNRREIVCPPCSTLYRRDVFHLVRAGLLGGKGVPETVTGHVRIFATLTAPSFGPVHAHRVNVAGKTVPCHPRRTGQCMHGAATSCLDRHGEDDPVVGAPLCDECYDYASAVTWQASMGELWRRFTIYTARHLAKVAGITQRELRAQVRLSYIKVAEYQRRGVVHVHAVIRADGIGDDDAPAGVVPAPDWVTTDLIAQAVRSAAAAVRVTVAGGLWIHRWGDQVDVRDITSEPNTGDLVGEGAVGEDGQTDGIEPVSAQPGAYVAAYVAKYASKGTETTGWTGATFDGTLRAEHARRMIATAGELSEVEALADLKLGRWARTLGYRGHVSSKSRRYSTTLTALRAERAAHRRTAAGLIDLDAEGVTVESSWRLVGFGYTPEQAFLAAQVAGRFESGHVAPGAGISRSGRSGRP